MSWERRHLPTVRGWKGSQNGMEYHPYDVAHRPVVHLLPLRRLWLPTRTLVASIMLPHPTVLWVGQRMLRSCYILRCCCVLHRFSSRKNLEELGVFFFNLLDLVYGFNHCLPSSGGPAGVLLGWHVHVAVTPPSPL